MADYWKSQAKKFCDFCKCWIADNKPSIQFHERGKRHKESVEQRLNQIRKKGIEDYNAEQNMASDFRQMEEAALKAYEKDLALNRDLTSQLYNASQMSKSKESECCKGNEETSNVQNVDEKEDVTQKKEEERNKAAVTSVKVWYEAVTDEGYPYYWNIQNAESRWEPPEEGFISIVEQEELYKEQNETADIKEETKEDSKTVDTTTGEPDQIRSNEEEKEDEEEEEENEEEQLGTMIGPVKKPDPYGGWKSVKQKKAEPLDLQLPEQELMECRVPAVPVEPSFKFKEKTVTSLCGSQDDGTSVNFKKRKFMGNHKQNIRRRRGEECDD